MGISIHISQKNGKQEIVSLVGTSELESLWMPVVESKQLNFLEYCFTAGLEIDSGNHAEISAEFAVLCSELVSVTTEEFSIENPVFRCKRCLNLLEAYKQNKTGDLKIYIG